MTAMSSWCPVSQVVVKGSAVDHFVVVVQPDTITHGDTATIHVQAKDKDNHDIQLHGETLLNALLDGAGQTYGTLIGPATTGPLVEISYEEIQMGKLQFVADGENPIGLDAQQVKISVVLSDDETKEGVATVAVSPSIEKFCQNDANWAGLDYDKYVDSVETNKQGKTVYYKIARKGCALTCMAMVAKAGGANLDPGRLAEYMNNPSHYGYGKDYGVKWGIVNVLQGVSQKFQFPISQGSGLKYDQKPNVDLSKSTTVELSSLDQYLTGGALIIAQVYNPTTRGNHWVLVTEKQGSKYSIIDPGCYEGRDDLQSYSNNIYKFVVYRRK